MKKTFFQRPSVAQKKNGVLKESRLDTIINDIATSRPSETLILPASDFPKKHDGAYGSRHAYREGLYIPIHQPEFVKSVGKQKLHDLVSDIPNRLAAHPHAFANTIGYSFKPVGWKHRDPEVKLVPFISLAKGLKLYAYAQSQSPIVVERSYVDHPYVSETGGIVHVTVPSEEEKQRRYHAKFLRVPTTDNLKVALSLKTDFPKEPPMYKQFDDSFSKPGRRFDQHEVAAYFGLVKHFGDQSELNPAYHNPFMVFGPDMMSFFTQIGQSVLIQDIEIKEKHKLRQPRLAEESLMLGRYLIAHGKSSLYRRGIDPKVNDYPCFQLS
ncbi:MAG: hypothetical protein ACMXYA_02555 [Candidatus Woesearchaeota archaeon]